MRCAGRIAEITAGRIIAMLVLEDTFQYEDLLPAVVRVTGESAAGSIAHDRRRAGDLAADAEQHPPVHTRCGTRHPALPLGMDNNGYRKIVVNVHGAAPS
jgi:hypothetical protein